VQSLKGRRKPSKLEGEGGVSGAAKGGVDMWLNQGGQRSQGKNMKKEAKVRGGGEPEYNLLGTPPKERWL